MDPERWESFQEQIGARRGASNSTARSSADPGPVAEPQSENQDLGSEKEDDNNDDEDVFDLFGSDDLPDAGDADERSPKRSRHDNDED
eukprot:12418909-Karenia_brevis.AAC.1